MQPITSNSRVPISADESLRQAADALQSAVAKLNQVNSLPTRSSVMDPAWVIWFLVALGLGSSFLAVLYAFRNRDKPWEFVKASVWGGGGSAVIAGLSSKIGGLTVLVTWADAAVISGTFFIIGCGVWSLLLSLGFWLVVMRPLRYRYGRVLSVQAVVEFWAGVDAFKAWTRDNLRSQRADAAWDEFACALQELSAELKSAELATDLQSRTFSVLGAPKSGESDETVAARVVRSSLGPIVEKLCARLTHTTLNFTVWRVAHGSDHLEHLVSLPVDPDHGAGYGFKEPLKIWCNRGKSRSGCLAAEAMLQGKYVVMTVGKKGWRWPRRQLGRQYDGVGAQPVPCQDANPEAWAVVCVESRDGSLPLESNAMRLLLGHIASAVDKTAPLLKRRTINQTRGISPTEARKPSTSEEIQDELSSAPHLSAMTRPISPDDVAPSNGERNRSPDKSEQQGR